MRDEYEQMWSEALAALGRYPDADVRRLKRLLLFGAMNWCAQWYHADGLYDVDAITDSLYESFIEAPPARRKK